MESKLTFNQLICGFESRHPCQSRANAECDYIVQSRARFLVARLSESSLYTMLLLA